jgi:hypothetical protein
MIEVSQCVICEGAIHRLKRALVAPFMATRIWNRNPFCVDLVECEACGFIFYNPRLDDGDLHRLYAGYRSEEYQRMRHASEPWYTPKFNVDLASPASYEFRRGLLFPILKQHIGDRKIDRILDYGGDRGDLVVDLFEGAQAFVYDISQIPAAPGVTSINDPAACNADLIINSNVLEHVGFPRTLVADMMKAAPEGGLVFIEAPREDPFGMGRIIRRIAQIGVISVLHPSLAPFLVRPASLYMMHEHVNSFTEQTLTTLMRSCGGTVIAAGSYPSSGRAGKGDMLWCMGMKPVASQV